MNLTLEERATSAGRAVRDASAAPAIPAFSPPVGRGDKLLVSVSAVVVVAVLAGIVMRVAQTDGDQVVAAERETTTVGTGDAAGGDANGQTGSGSDLSTAAGLYYVIDHSSMEDLTAVIHPNDGEDNSPFEIFGDPSADNPFGRGVFVLNIFPAEVLEQLGDSGGVGSSVMVGGTPVWTFPFDQGSAARWEADNGHQVLTTSLSLGSDELIDVVEHYLTTGQIGRGLESLVEWKPGPWGALGYGGGVHYTNLNMASFGSSFDYEVGWRAESRMYEARLYAALVSSDLDGVDPAEAWERVEPQQFNHGGRSVRGIGSGQFTFIEIPVGAEGDGYLSISQLTVAQPGDEELAAADGPQSVDGLLALVDSLRPATSDEIADMVAAGEALAARHRPASPEPGPGPDTPDVAEEELSPDAPGARVPSLGATAVSGQISPETRWTLSFADNGVPCVSTTSPVTTTQVCATATISTATDGTRWYFGYGNSIEILALDAGIDRGSVGAVWATTFGGERIDGEVGPDDRGETIWYLNLGGPADSVPAVLHLRLEDGEVRDFVLPEFVGESIDSEGLAGIAESVEYLISVVPYDPS